MVISMEIKARIPGKVMEVKVKEGDTVKTKTVLAVMEAMKMEQPIASPLDGTVKEVKVAANDKVKAGQVLLIVE